MGSLDAKLAWAKAAGAVGAFTWIHPGRSREFTRRSGVPHHWLPFGVEIKPHSIPETKKWSTFSTMVLPLSPRHGSGALGHFGGYVDRISFGTVPHS